ncbi:MAG: ABC transporter substrate-binding protein [Alicyclobacillus sp.]|nr:ABC transporter substrate-binding protein [Alicyclobacillus sp.]
MVVRRRMGQATLASAAGVVLALSTTTWAMAGTASKSLPTVSIALSTWTGFAPLYVAEEKGFFDKEGVHVNLEKMEAVADRRSAMAANRIQGFTTTVDSHVVTAATGIPVTQVLALDDSYGGDGIVAKKNIKSLKDLRGKTVAVQTDGGASYFFFLYLLQKAGIDPKSIKFQSMTAGDAGAAFVAGKVDAAVTWEPWLSRAEHTSFGHVLIKSTATPGVITDTLGLRTDFVKAHPDKVKAIVRGWFDALKYIKTHKADAYAIMAKNMGQSVADFTPTVSTIRWYDQKMNRAYFGHPVTSGKLYQLTNMAANFWLKHGIISKKPNIAALVDGQFVQ